MEILSSILMLAVLGLLVGALGRLALPGRDPMTLTQTMLTGVAATLIVGLLGIALFGAQGVSILLAVVVATAIVFAVRKMRERGERAAPAAGSAGRR